jgi:hypothetical protein
VPQQVVPTGARTSPARRAARRSRVLVSPRWAVEQVGWTAARSTRLVTVSAGNRLSAPRDGVQQRDLLETGPAGLVEVVLGVVQQPAGAEGRVDDHRQRAVPAPLLQRIAGGGGHPFVSPDVALAAPRGRAAIWRPGRPGCARRS